MQFVLDLQKFEAPINEMRFISTTSNTCQNA